MNKHRIAILTIATSSLLLFSCVSEDQAVAEELGFPCNVTDGSDDVFPGRCLKESQICLETNHVASGETFTSCTDTELETCNDLLTAAPFSVCDPSSSHTLQCEKFSGSGLKAACTHPFE